MTLTKRIDTKPPEHRKQCSVCGRTNSYSLKMKESMEYIPSILWQEYGGMVICIKCFAGTRAA